MDKCPNCGRELGRFKIGSIYWYNKKRFCSISCKDNYANKHPAKIEAKQFNQLSTATQTASVGLLGGSALSIVGIMLMVIGTILLFTIIGAPIGILLLIIGFILFIGSGIFAGAGLLGGLFIKIVKLFERKK